MNNVLIHTRKEEEASLLKNNFDLNALGDNHRFVFGLSRDTQRALTKAADKGWKIVSNGLPVDIASELGEITIIRAWDITKDDGSRSTGTSTPKVHYIGEVTDFDAYERLKSNEDFIAAFERVDILD